MISACLRSSARTSAFTGFKFSFLIPVHVSPRIFIFHCLVVFLSTSCVSCAQHDSNEINILNSISDVENLTSLFFKSRNVSSTITSEHDELVAALEELLSNLKSRSKASHFGVRNSNCTKETNDSKVNEHTRCDTSKKCLSAGQLVDLVPNSSHTLTGVVSRTCPWLLFQLYSGTCEDTQQEVVDTTSHGKARPSPSEVWGYGILFVTLISCCSMVGVVILPLLNKDFYFVVLMLFEGLAVGSLVGSAIFHLIPQAFSLLGQDAQHGYLWKSLILFGGIYLFYFSEQTMKIIIQIRKKRSNTASPVDEKVKPLLRPSSSNSSAINGISQDTETDVKVNFLHEEKTESSIANGNASSLILPPHTYDLSQESEKIQHHEHHHDHHVKFEPGKSTVGTVAWMIIFGDGLHNFIDGLSIGAAFSESVLAGISISVAVVCEEFPHELGDFAVLLSAGMSMRQAIVYNFLSACTCYLGLVFGILLGDLTEGSPYILALAGGMFLYIALVDMVGELNEGIREANKVGICHTLKVLLLQNTGIFLGVITLFVMARYSELIDFDAVGSAGNKTVLSYGQVNSMSSEPLTLESPGAFGF